MGYSGYETWETFKRAVLREARRQGLFLRASGEIAVLTGIGSSKASSMCDLVTRDDEERVVHSVSVTRSALEANPLAIWDLLASTPPLGPSEDDKGEEQSAYRLAGFKGLLVYRVAKRRQTKRGKP